MTAEDQLTYVARYFAPQRGRLHNLGDLYCTILLPAGIGKPDDAVLFAEGGARHRPQWRGHARRGGRQG